MIALPAPLELPLCAPGLGSLIQSHSSKDLIAGVQIAPVTLWPDDRGYFLELVRMKCGLASSFPAESTQVSASMMYPGNIKAFHFHLKQTDLWTAVAGMLQVALVDLRSSSPTFGSRNTIYTGILKPLQVLIPPGVAHGYKVIGTDPGMLVYATDRFYDPADEGRIPYDEPSINYDWTIQHK